MQNLAKFLCIFSRMDGIIFLTAEVKVGMDGVSFYVINQLHSAMLATTQATPFRVRFDTFNSLSLPA